MNRVMMQNCSYRIIGTRDLPDNGKAIPISTACYWEGDTCFPDTYVADDCG